MGVISLPTVHSRRFQSSIAPKGNRYFDRPRRDSVTRNVPILDRPEGQSLRRQCARKRIYSMFQSSIAPKGNRYARYTLKYQANNKVPILDRPEGQSLLPNFDFCECLVLFQSSIAPKGNRYDLTIDRNCARVCKFQSSIAPKGNRYEDDDDDDDLSPEVPILDRPEGQSLHNDSGRNFME